MVRKHEHVNYKIHMLLGTTFSLGVGHVVLVYVQIMLDISIALSVQNGTNSEPNLFSHLPLTRYLFPYFQ